MAELTTKLQRRRAKWIQIYREAYGDLKCEGVYIEDVCTHHDVSSARLRQLKGDIVRWMQEDQEKSA